MRHLEYMPIDTIEGANTNPKNHHIPGVQASINRFGYVAPMIIDERTQRLVAGHGRLESLRVRRDAGETPPEGITLDEDGCWLVPVLRGWASRSDPEASAYLVADNRYTELGGWDHQALSNLLEEIADPDLIDLTGWDTTDLEELLADTDPADPDPADDDQDSSNDGAALEALSSVTTPDPTFAISPGDVWWLGERHILVCASPFTDHRIWAPLLTDDAIFMPFPSTMAPFATTAPGRRIVLVQPNTYLAAFTVTRWERITGGKAVRDGEQR